MWVDMFEMRGMSWVSDMSVSDIEYIECCFEYIECE